MQRGPDRLAAYAPLLAACDRKALSEEKLRHLGHQALVVDGAVGVVCVQGGVGSVWGRWGVAAMESSAVGREAP